MLLHCTQGWCYLTSRLTTVELVEQAHELCPVKINHVTVTDAATMLSRASSTDSNTLPHPMYNCGAALWRNPPAPKERTLATHAALIEHLHLLAR